MGEITSYGRFRRGRTHFILWLSLCLTSAHFEAASVQCIPTAISVPEQLKKVGSSGGPLNSHFNTAGHVLQSNRFQMEANNCFKNRKYKEAIELFAQAIEANPVRLFFILFTAFARP